MILYHGTSEKNALSILKNGFDINRAGENWGKTYGIGIYFSPNYETAKFYANSNSNTGGIVISINIKLNTFNLKKDISPSNKKKIKIPKGYDSIISLNKDEIIIIDQSILINH